MRQQEANAQIKVISYCTLRGIPVFHIPNGGSRNKMEAANLKRQGVKAGVPDLCFPAALHGYHGLFVEMKAGRNKTTQSQEEWLDFLAKSGYCVRVCWGFDEARDVIDWYFEKGQSKAGCEYCGNAGVRAVMPIGSIDGLGVCNMRYCFHCGKKIEGKDSDGGTL